MTKVFDSPDPSVGEHVRRTWRRAAPAATAEGGVTNLVLTHRGPREVTGEVGGTQPDRP